MLAVIFEVCPHADQQDAYLSIARMLRPELEQIDGFVDNIRYRSLTRDGWLLSLSSWRDEAAVIRWRTQTRHRAAQERGRAEIFTDYRLRVGQVTGEPTTVTLVDAGRSSLSVNGSQPEAVARQLGLASDAPDPAAWDVFDALLTPGDAILLLSWRRKEDAEAFERAASLPAGARVRHVHVTRDYGMFDRREAPQHDPEVRQAPQ